MKTRLLPWAPALALIALGGPVLAQSTENSAAIQTTFRGSALAGCRLNTPTSPSSQNAQVSALSPGSADIAISQMTDANGEAIGATIVLVLPAICNQAHTLNLASLNGGLLGNGPVSGGAFRSRVPYSVTVAWAGGLQSFVTQDQTLSFSVGEAASGPVTVTIEIPSGGVPLAAGAYSDELVLELGIAG